MDAAAKFCSECGSPVERAARSAEYKQVTVLFADVVRSMDLAAAVGAERLREIMTELVERSAAVVKRYDGTVDKFTGDGLMAVFGARWRWRTTLSVRAWRAWAFRRRRNGSRSRSESGTASTCSCGSGSTPVR